MKVQAFIKLLLVVVITFAFSCSKEKVDVLYEVVETNTSAPLRAVTAFEDTIYIAGGEKFETGILGKIVNEVVWEQIECQSINAAKVIDNNLFVGSTDGKLINLSNPNWNVIQLNVPDFGWKPIKSFSATNSGIISVGGEGYFIGYIAKYNLGNNSTIYTVFEQQIFDIQMVDNVVGYACGFGIVLKTINGGENWEVLNLKGDIFTSLYFIDDSNGWIVGDEGGIWQTSDGGLNWGNVRKQNNVFKKYWHWSDVIMLNDDEIWIAGETGIWYTLNQGKKWLKIQNLPDCEFNEILNYKNYILAVGNNGCFVKIER